MSDEECICPKPKPGIPPWMATFADLMTLLMCFFVLLLSFSEMDVLKFKQLAGSMSSAFGVQRQVKFEHIPMGTSIIAREFSPGRPQPTPIAQIYQQVDEKPDVTLKQPDSEQPGQGLGERMADEEARLRIENLIKQTEGDATDLAIELSEQIRKGEVEIETEGRKIVIRIRERGSFSSGSAELAAEYRDVMAKVSGLIATKPGKVVVQGHSDNVPIATERYRSNWELSSARAVSVAHELIRDGTLVESHLTVTGHADTIGLVDNDTSENRARNRRVEIVINQGFNEDELEDLETVKESNPVFYESLELNSRYDILPGEVF